LRSDLAASTKTCTLAVWHRPLFTSGPAGPYGPVAPLWKALYDFGADLVLTGHSHIYERFAPQTSTGAANSAFGLREITVGTGGEDLEGAGAAAANSQVRGATTFGVLLLNLRQGGYDWSFIPVLGQ